MRRLLATSLLLLAGLLAACDLTGLPTAPTPTATLVPPSPTATLEPTSLPTAAPSATPVAQLQDSPTPAETAVTSTASGTPAPGGGSTEAERQLAQIEEATTQIRGLDPKTPVKAEFIPQDQMKANLADEVNTEYPADVAKRDSHALWLLRLLKDPAIDLRQLQIDLLGEQVLGYYDPKKKDLFVLNRGSSLSPLARMTLSHEFVHSLQDQYYDLQKIRPDNIDSDRGSAATALIEGDAVASQFAYARTNMNLADLQAIDAEVQSMSSTVLDNAPRFIREDLNFPYEQGPIFIGALAQSQPGSFAAIDAALADPPQSTEQIFHPEKYLNKPRDEPVTVTVPPLTSTLGAGWTFQDSDTIGEFGLRILLEENGANGPTPPGPTPTVEYGTSPDTPANRAAAGWGGAEYALYDNAAASGSLLALSTRWDTPEDADEFDAAMKDTFSSLKKDGSLWADGKRFFGLTASGRNVVYVAGTDRAAVERTLAVVKP